MPLTIVAEVGSNWWRPDRDEALEAALEHVRLAARSGATAVKFQLFRAETLYSQNRFLDGFEQAKKYELPLNWLASLSHHAHEIDMEFWLSVFDPELVEACVAYVDKFKIASGDVNYVQLLSKVGLIAGQYDIPVVISTGASTGNEVKKAVNTVLLAAGGLARIEICLIYCVSNYPARPEDYRLHRFPWSDMASEIGVSDHTTGTELLERAIDWGYTVFEKHFKTADTPPELPDAGFALGPAEFDAYCGLAHALFDRRYRGEFGDRPDEAERFWARRGPDGLRPAVIKLLDWN